MRKIGHLVLWFGVAWIVGPVIGGFGILAVLIPLDYVVSISESASANVIGAASLLAGVAVFWIGFQSSYNKRTVRVLGREIGGPRE